MNPRKSSLLVGKASNISKVQHILGIEVGELPSTYLGLPFFAGRLTKALCVLLVNMFKRKLDSWKCKLLPRAGKVELIISTFSTFAIFLSVAFPLPSSTIKELEKYCRDFLWGDSKDKKVHLVSWNSVFQKLKVV